MSPENQNKAGDTKKKITIVLVVVILGFVGWQAMGLIGGGSSPAPAPTPTKTMSNVKPSTSNGAPAGQPAMPAPVASDNTPKQAPVQANAELLKLQQETQAKYIAALNELEMLKLQKSIAETKQAITSSTLATATAEKSITDLLTAQVSQMPTSNNNLSNQYSPFAANTPAQDSTSLGPNGQNGQAQPMPMPAKPNMPETQYVLQSVAYKSEKWTAAISVGKDVYNVVVGDTLPTDGSVVTGIDKNSVTLLKDKVTRHILFTPTSS
jgi:type IV pilus biogenesis protein PilP